jgi:hypothetical protein
VAGEEGKDIIKTREPELLAWLGILILEILMKLLVKNEGSFSIMAFFLVIKLLRILLLVPMANVK